MRRAVVILALAWLLAGPARASEEDILPTRKLSLTADGSRDFGEVTAAVETAEDGRLRSVTLVVAGKCHAVPQEQFAGLGAPLLNTAQIRVEAGQGGPPWLYLTFRLARPGAAPADCPLAYIPFRDGRLMEPRVRPPSR
jgi:hypothetical protein